MDPGLALLTSWLKLGAPVDPEKVECWRFASIKRFILGSYSYYSSVYIYIYDSHIISIYYIYIISIYYIYYINIWYLYITSIYYTNILYQYIISIYYIYILYLFIIYIYIKSIYYIYIIYIISICYIYILYLYLVIFIICSFSDVLTPWPCYRKPRSTVLFDPKSTRSPWPAALTAALQKFHNGPTARLGKKTLEKSEKCCR